MNGAHLHLAVNHIPVIGVQFALIALLISYLKKSDDGMRLSFILFIVAGFSVLLPLATGEMAEEVVKDFHKLMGSAHVHAGGKSLEDSVHPHEEAAEVGAFLAILCGLLGAAGLYMKDKMRLIALVLIVAGALAMAQLGLVANLGGEIHHQEMKLQNGVLPLGEVGHSHGGAGHEDVGHEHGESAVEEALEHITGHEHGESATEEAHEHTHGAESSAKASHSASGGHSHADVPAHH